MTENTVIIGDFVYSHVNIMYVCNLKAKFLVTVNYFFGADRGTHSQSVQNIFNKHSIQQT